MIILKYTEVKQRNIAILGGGNLGASIAKGLIAARVNKHSQICVTRRRSHLLDDLKKEGLEVTRDNLAAVKNAEIVIISVKPHHILELLEEIKAELTPEKHLVISTVSGVSIQSITDVIGNIPVYRAMPNTAVAIRESMTCIASDGDNGHLDDIIDFFNQLGMTRVIAEELMGAATVVGACGIAFVLRFMRAMSQGGIEIGFGSEVSQLITAQTIKGASNLILQSGNHPEREIDKVTTPRGITISGLNEMEHQGLSSAVIKGLLSSYNKLEKLSEKNKK